MKQSKCFIPSSKWLILLLVLLLLTPLSIAWAQEDEENILGTGDTSITVMVVTSVYDYPAIYTVLTNETNLLDALLDVCLINGEEASWGFNVTIVDGREADYEATGEYWQITQHVDGEGHLPLQTGIGDAPVQEGDIFAFSLEGVEE